jgi:exoribonuclease-2
VTRLTYDEVEGRLDEEPFRDLYCLTQAYQARRAANGAVSIDLPEVSVRVKEGQVILRRLPPLQSRALVEGTMIMAGEAVARFAIERGIPLPFATQEPPDPHEAPRTLSAMFALRRTLKRSQYRSIPAPHGGLGLSAYSQATSPLRRYLDLVVHQQLRAYLRGEQLLSEQDVLERVGAIEAIIGNVRQAERLSNTHWTLVYLLQHPKWRGEGIVVEKAGLNESSVASLRGNPAHTLRGRLLIPELGLETQMQLPADLPLDASVPLAVSWVDLPHLDVRFRTDFSRTAHSALAGMGRTNKELLC